MDFLDHCESAARFARQEARLRERLGSARSHADAAEAARLTDELELATMEKRFAVLRALDSTASSARAASRPG